MPQAHPNPYLVKAVLWFLGGAFFLCAFGAFLFIIPAYYELVEPIYKVPVELMRPSFKIRRDRMGDGSFGASRSNNRIHNGIDITAKIGALVLASKSGRVLFAGPKGGYGNTVQILHPDGFNTRYAHLSESLTKKGDWVHQGQTVGQVGKTGNARSRLIQPHLHFEIRDHETALNPSRYLTVRL